MTSSSPRAPGKPFSAKFLAYLVARLNELCVELETLRKTKGERPLNDAERKRFKSVVCELALISEQVRIGAKGLGVAVGFAPEHQTIEILTPEDGIAGILHRGDANRGAQ